MKASDKDYKTGWYDQERDDQGPFRWMARQATLSLEGQMTAGENYLRIIAGHSFPEETPPCLTVYLNGQKIGEEAIEAAYSPYFFPFSATCAPGQIGELSIKAYMLYALEIPFSVHKLFGQRAEKRKNTQKNTSNLKVAGKI